MPFDYAGFFRFAYLWLFRSPWTLRRSLVAAAFVLVVPPLQLLTRLALRLDQVVFPAHQRQPVESPVFVIGNPRSGTTLLHRLLALDGNRFATMRMWEILLAPSLIQRKLGRALARLDGRLGGPLSRRLRGVERGWRHKNVMHRVSLFAPEEDDYLLLYAWSALTTGLSSGLLEEARPYLYFDVALSNRRRSGIMRFYRGCIQRHLYAGAPRATGRRYLAKNPALCSKLDSLLDEFPDAKIIYLARNPLDVIPSYVSMMEYSWQAVGVPVERGRLQEFVVEMAAHWYRYPLERLAREPAARYIVVKYDDLIADPRATVERIYRHFGYRVDEDFNRLLTAEAARAHRFDSRHSYSLEELGLSRARILAQFHDVFERFGFARETAGSAAGKDESARHDSAAVPGKLGLKPEHRG